MKKEELHRFCLEIILAKRSSLELSIADLNISIENESKSSAGDKHETSRAMLHLEIEKLTHQLHEINLQYEMLLKLSDAGRHQKVETGSLVTTNRGIFYIAVALGKINFLSKDLFVISPASPLATGLKNKTLHDEVMVNGVQYVVETIG